MPSKLESGDAVSQSQSAPNAKVPSGAQGVQEGDLLWVPSPERKNNSNLQKYLNWLAAEQGLNFSNYDELWNWSIQDKTAFWASIWEYFEVKASKPYTRILSGETMFETRWFEGASLNFSEHLIRHEHIQPDKVAIKAFSESRPPVHLTWAELGKVVRSVATALRAMGIQPGDNVVSYMPNIPETSIAMIAATSIGAVWAAAAPEFGPKTVVDRFGQLKPKLIFAANGYSFGGKDFCRDREVAKIIDELPTIEHVVYLPLIDINGAEKPNFEYVPWNDLAGAPAPSIDEFQFEQVSSDHPLWILFSSGTSGLPKAIVHGHGGILLEHLKAQHLHMELTPDSMLFFYCTTSWMVWNSTLSALLAGSGIVLFDGNPIYPDSRKMWEIVENSGATVLGSSPTLVTRMEKDGVVPRNEFDLSKLEMIVLGGAPATPEVYQWFYRDVKDDFILASQSGGTEICSGIMGAVVFLPVYAGEMQARMLGFDLQSWSDDGTPIVNEIGELVICSAFPSMPLSFCNDPDRTRYYNSYFDHFPGTWLQGDLFKLNDRGGCFIYGRSDTTLNRHGVRIGTAEIYRTLETITEIVDGIAVCVKDGTPDANVILFLKMQAGESLDDHRSAITEKLRTENSPRHVPDQMIAVPEIPYTLTGKRLEAPLRKILDGHDVNAVVKSDMMLNPAAMDWYIEYIS